MPHGRLHRWPAWALKALLRPSLLLRDTKAPPSPTTASFDYRDLCGSTRAKRLRSGAARWGFFQDPMTPRRTFPQTISADGDGRSLMSDIIVTLLPGPLSPTTPSSSPGRSAKLIPLTAWIVVSRVLKTIRRAGSTKATPRFTERPPSESRIARPVSSQAGPRVLHAEQAV